ncbi:DUF2249 domain-containing protein [Ramlibacter algicola]|uniref:DUF2249 domain-containing protein n=1 Tax=Ramlibacter algicola TaxID=2795217 RepID=A0A934PXX6_9BURK|nr:DUF2249 domain-containing protein [Ramlibacter algicola]MBK0392570.1 DUF2249 domain-containing protein [Ramlibacter algicola]
MSDTVARVDVRSIEPRRRHPIIFLTFQDLAEGEAMELLCDHDPVVLKSHFELLAPQESEWNYLERGPQTWRVGITRVRSAPPEPTCCGACGGGGH